MNQNSNRNATASWSGFSHQGQVGILIALRELQKEGLDKEKTFVQFEEREDIAVYIQSDEENVDNRYLSVHQVKAYYSNGSHRKSTYSPVLNNTFAEGEYKFLHTTTEITDWDTSTTQNNNEIERYEYDENIFHCNTTEIEDFIKIELEALIGENRGKIESAIKRLTYQLDLKIRNKHKKKHKHLFDIKFSLLEIKEIVFDDSEFVFKEIFDCRKLFYDIYIESLEFSTLENSELKIIENLIVEIYHTLSDEEFFYFTQRLSLSRNPNHINLTQSTFNEDGLRQVFFKLLLNIPNEIPKLNKDELTILYSKYQFVLTTIIDEKNDAKRVVKNIINNLDSQLLLWESTSIINKEINGTFHELLPEFFDIRNKEEKTEDFKKFMEYNGSTSFICRETAKEKLTNEDTN